ncbi:apicoplast ribosomal protein S6, putative [Hepatocystis sp. ex Piliocolobus tephrosceles]|nr:apicoplast ribosomal protein S6, putative [Hepatocystis sp. ex Piliocolobus tephrosceles]
MQPPCKYIFLFFLIGLYLGDIRTAHKICTANKNFLSQTKKHLFYFLHYKHGSSYSLQTQHMSTTPYDRIIKGYNMINKRRTSSHINKYTLYSSLNDYIYKLLIKKFKKVKKEKEIYIYKQDLSAKCPYTIDFLFSCNYPIKTIKSKLIEYQTELRLINAERFKIVYLGKKKLIRPIKKQTEAYYITLSLHIYPSIIKEISEKLRQQDHILRFIIIKNKNKTDSIPFTNEDIVEKSLEKIEESFFKR